MTTASNAILTDSINPILATDTLSIGDSQTSGNLILGTNVSRTGSINIGSTGNSAPIYIQTSSFGNSFNNPAITIAANCIGSVRIGNETTTTYLSKIAFNADTINTISSNDDFNISNGQTTGATLFGSATSRTADINIATGAGSGCAVNIHNGTSSTGSVNIAISTQSTPVNIQSGTGTGTVTIGNANNIVTINGAVALQKPLGIISIPTPTNARLGWRSANLITDPTPFVTTLTTAQTAKSFSVTSGLWLFELRVQATTSSNVEMTLTQIPNQVDVTFHKSVRMFNPSIVTLSITTTTSASGNWNVNVRSDLVGTSFNNFYLFATRIG